MFTLTLAIIFFLGALICYTSCCAAAKADRQSEEWFRLKIQEADIDKKIESDK